MTTVLLLDKCSKLLDQTFKEGLDAFEYTAKSVETFIAKLPREERERQFDRISSLNERLDRCRFQIGFQRLQQAHVAGREVRDDLMGFVDPSHPNY